MIKYEDNSRHYEKSVPKFTTKHNQVFSPKKVGNHRNWPEKN